MEDKTRSLAFLSLLCFGLADVRDGLGPFLGVYLQQQGWTADEIGIIKRGRLIARGTLDELRHGGDSSLEEVFLELVEKKGE